MIEVQSLSKSFDGIPVLNTISFKVERAESFVVLGQSGVGKSVLLKTLAGLLHPDKGKISLRSRNIGMLFQKNALFDSFTVSENLEFPLRERTNLPAKLRKEKVKKFLQYVELSGTETLFPDELSGGMQKRLGIARALIVEPEIIFYDEPTAGLDPITSRVIVDLILRLSQELGTTMVSVTSDVQRALQLADRIGFLQKTPEGSLLLETGTPEQTRSFEHSWVQRFLTGKGAEHVHTV